MATFPAEVFPTMSIDAVSVEKSSAQSQMSEQDAGTQQDHFSMTFAPLSHDTVYRLATDAANGAVVVMSGTVRNQTDGKPVKSLEYQAYEPMALNIFRQIAAEIRGQWPDTNRIVIHHRTGHLNIGEMSVLVAVGCPHRGEAFSACQYAIDALKHNAPIWKKEHWADGSSEWVSIAACEDGEKHHAGA